MPMRRLSPKAGLLFIPLISSEAATAAKAAEDAGDAADKDKADKDKDKKDETTGYKIPKEFRDVAPEASATVTISSSKIH